MEVKRNADAAIAGGANQSLPAPGADRVKCLRRKVSESVAVVLQLSSVGDVGTKPALPDMGTDWVVTVILKKALDQNLMIQVL